jgi:ATP-dependent RNA helicase RhlE
VDVMIATPGRLLDHMRHQYAKLGRLQYLVLDEADRMLDMGFLPEIRKILKQLPSKRQTLFFSATLPAEIRTLMTEMLVDPVNVHRERTGGAAGGTTPSGITQAVYPVAQDLKAALLTKLLTRGDIKQALVFTRTKHRANRLADSLVRAGIKADRIHGNRSQSQRVQALAAFKAGACPVLVATDIVARGIDVEDLGHVVNFDVPLVPEDYIHRVGRTGRAEAVGEAFTLAAPEERTSLAAIERAIGRPLPRVTVPDFDYSARPSAQLEVPLAQRIAEIRKRKAEDRKRADEKRARAGAQERARSTGGRGGDPRPPHRDPRGGGRPDRFRSDGPRDPRRSDRPPSGPEPRSGAPRGGGPRPDVDGNRAPAAPDRGRRDDRSGGIPEGGAPLSARPDRPHRPQGGGNFRRGR